MPRWLRLFAALVPLALVGCGDGTFIISVNTGSIAGDPRCDGDRGEFDLRETGGLTVLVVITSSTRVIVDSSPGRCNDLAAGSDVEVSGRERDDRIVATEVRVR